MDTFYNKLKESYNKHLFIQWHCVDFNVYLRKKSSILVKTMHGELSIVQPGFKMRNYS